jgi:integrase
MTIARAASRWWNEHGRHLADPALKTPLDRMVDLIGPRTLLHAITDDIVAKLVEARRHDVVKAGREKKSDGSFRQLWRPITARTVNNTTVVLLRRVLRRARDNWNVAILREPVWKNHLLKQTRPPVRELTPAEDLVLDGIESADYIALRRFAEITGLRRRNLLLSWPQVDFETAVIRLVTKGGVPRVLPLTREAYAILWAQRGRHAQFVWTFVAAKTRRCPKTGRKLIKGTRYPITYYGIGSNVRKWRKAGVDVSMHKLRHTAGMRILRATGNLKAVQKVLGHSDIAITAKFYTDANTEDQRAAMEAGFAATPAAPGLKKTEDGET